VRKANFVRIYPARGCELYDQYFLTQRPSNRFLQRYLLFEDVVPYPLGYLSPAAPPTEARQKSTREDPN
jgi:hypothetical protein